jgi:hypothetical protein
MYALLSLIHATCPAHLILLDLISRIKNKNRNKKLLRRTEKLLVLPVKIKD